MTTQTMSKPTRLLFVCLLIICLGVSAFVAVFALLSGDDGIALGYPIAAGAIFVFLGASAALIVWARRANAPQDARSTRLALRKPKLSWGAILPATIVVLTTARMYFAWQETSIGPAWAMPTPENLLRVDGTLVEFNRWRGRNVPSVDSAIIRTANGQNMVFYCTPGTDSGGCFSNVQIGAWIYHGSAKLSMPVTITYFHAQTNLSKPENVLVELRTADAVPISYESRMQDLKKEYTRHQNRMRRPNIFHLFMLGIFGLALFTLIFERVPVARDLSDAPPDQPNLLRRS